MTQQPALTGNIHRVDCHAGRAKLITRIAVDHGFTTWCQGCRIPHLVEWQSLPSSVLSEMVEAINKILVARIDPGA